LGENALAGGGFARAEGRGVAVGEGGHER
jgi:hypothetical protein